MRNKVMDALLSLKQKELDELREASKNYVPSSLYLYENLGTFNRRASEFTLQDMLHGNIKVLIDEPLSSEMKRLLDAGNGSISDIERLYTHFKRSNQSSSIDILGHFSDEYRIRTLEEVLCTAVYLIGSYTANNSAVIRTLLKDGQENLDLGIVILKKPMIKGMYEPEVAYNVHLEMKKGHDSKVEEIHLHIFEFPRSFKPNRHCLV